MDKNDKIKASDRFMPCFLYKFTDDEPHQKVEHYTRALTISQMKQDILRNIEMIFNSKSRLNEKELMNDKELIKSVLGFGLLDFCGETKSDESIAKMRKHIIDQLTFFEPRVRSSSIDVRVVEKGSAARYICELEITGAVEITPLNGELLFLSSLDLETGSASVRYLE